MKVLKLTTNLTTQIRSINFGRDVTYKVSKYANVVTFDSFRESRPINLIIWEVWFMFTEVVS